MKIRVRREAFLKDCRLAERVLPERVVDPAMGCLLLRAEEGACTLRAVGPEAAVLLRVSAVVEEAGEALLPAGQALAILREAAAEEVALESAAGRVLVRGEGALFDLEAPPPSAGLHPPLRELVGPIPKGACHRLPADLFCRAVRRTLFAVGEQTSRYSLQGVLWETESDRVRLVATDNKRLAVSEVPAAAPGKSLPPAPRLLPARAVDLLARLAEDGEERVQAVFGERHAFFRVGAATLWARYVEGPFPAWRKAVPPRAPHLFPLPVGPFLAGVRQAAVLREREHARLLLRFEPGRVTLESRQAGAGQSRVLQPLPFAGGPVEVVLNPRFLVELLRAFDADNTLLLGLTDRDTAALFSDGDSYTHVLMPVGPRVAARGAYSPSGNLSSPG
jgi:DNA polymerase-3 subunit beta